MLQYSVYARVCNGNDAVTKHRARLTGQLPPMALCACWW
ncbi:MAG: hypothetical protein ACLRZH_12565 [Ruthenibacterium lactatiformans]